VELTETLCLIPILICFRYQDGLQAGSRMDAMTNVGSYPLQIDVDIQGYMHDILEKLRCNFLYERTLLFSYSFEVLLL
jgi:hypothetical protein